MSLPFDATLKDLGREHPQAVLTAFDRLPTVPLRLLNIDLSTVTTAGDLIIGLGDPLEEIIHFDFQASASATKHREVLVLNSLLHEQYKVPVHSIVVLLRPQAAHSNLSGTVSYTARPNRGSMNFSYEVIPLWERPALALLMGELPVAPLAVLGQLPEGVELREGLTLVAQRLIERLEREATRDLARKLLTAAWVLTGLRVRRDVAVEIFRGVRAMRESDTYMAIIDEGREEGMKSLLLLLGEERFGPSDESIRARLESITDLEQLRRLGVRLLRVSNWQALLETP
jgi:hypothetical protein